MRFLRWPQIIRLRLRSLLNPRSVEQEMEDELHFHLDEQIQHHLERGQPPEEARRAALLAMGGLEQRKEEIRDARRVRLVDDLVWDIRYSFRAMRSDPGFTALAVLMLALGIGVNTGVFSLLNPVLFPSMPYPDADQLVNVFRTVPQSDSWSMSVPGFLDYRGQNDTFSGMAAFNWTDFSLAAPGQGAERVPGLLATSDYFSVLGVQPAFGRVFTKDDDQPGAPPVVVLSHALWRTRFAGDRQVVGRTIRIDGGPVAVIGVMPASFDDAAVWGPVEMWRPFAFTDQQRQQWGSNFLNIVGRIKPGVSAAQADSDIKIIAARLRTEHPDINGPQDSARVAPLIPAVERHWALLALAISLFVLLIACVNLASLQFARTAARVGEFSIRAAIGGSGNRIVRQCLTESLLLSLLGCAVALPAALWTASILYDRYMRQFAAPGIQLDWRILAFAVLCSVLSTVLFGTAPALLAGRTDVNQVLKANQRHATSSRGQRRSRERLVSVEITLVFILLASAGLAIGGLRDAKRVDRGWLPEGLLTARLILNGPQYVEQSRRAALLNQLETRLAALPGVRKVSFSTTPMTNWSSGLDWSESYLQVEGRNADPILVEAEPVSPAFFETVHLKLRRGRAFTHQDIDNRADVLIINEKMAKRLFSAEDPIGRRMRNPPDGNWDEIVGVVDDLRFPYRPVAMPDSDLQVYLPITQRSHEPLIIQLRTAAAPETLAQPLRQVIAAIDSDLAVFEVATGPEVIAQTLLPQTVPSILLVFFAALALVLAAIGIGGVMSYSVARRTAEIGIRMALGAERRAVLWLILKQGAGIISAGAVMGLAGAVLTTIVFSKVIPPLRDNAPFAMFGSAGVLLAAAFVACFIPAHRAARLVPLDALRDE